MKNKITINNNLQRNLIGIHFDAQASTLSDIASLKKDAS